MNLKVFNESFSKYYTEGADIIETDTSFLQELKNALEGDVRYLKEVRQTNPMLQAYKLQATIEELVPDKSWWEVTDCNINGELSNGLPLDKIVDCIIDNLKQEHTNTDESFNESAEDTEFPLAFIPVNDIAGKDFTHTLIGIVRRAGVKYHSAKKYAGNYYITIICKPEDLPKAKLAIENSGFFKSWLDKNESFNESSNRESIYDEPELLGKGYAAPTSIDYADEVKYKLKYNALEDLQNLQELMNATIARVEDFDEYWNAHKAAIMKNIKEAQDLIPTEYRA